jgi:hypothetical protein
MLHIGFTGTRQGMTPAQADALAQHLAPYAEAEAWAFHHGDCQGADAQAHAIAWMLGAIVYVHPPKNGTWRAYCAGPSRVLRQTPLPYLQRNHAIVDVCDVLIAAPRTGQEERRSGTWATIRDAQKMGKPVIIVPPEATAEQGVPDA